jgi:hypothetical protein
MGLLVVGFAEWYVVEFVCFAVLGQLAVGGCEGYLHFFPYGCENGVVDI